MRCAQSRLSCTSDVELFDGDPMPVQVLMLEMLVRSAFILNRMAHRHVRFLGAQLVQGSGASQKIDKNACTSVREQGQTGAHTDGTQKDSWGMPSNTARASPLADSQEELPLSDNFSLLRPSDSGSLAMDVKLARESCINLYLSLQGGQCVMSVLVDTSSWKVIETVYQPRGILRDRWVYKDWFCWQDQLWHPRSIHHWSCGQTVQVLHTDVAERLNMGGTAPFDMCGFKSRPSGEHACCLYRSCLASLMRQAVNSLDQPFIVNEGCP